MPTTLPCIDSLTGAKLTLSNLSLMGFSKKMMRMILVLVMHPSAPLLQISTCSTKADKHSYLQHTVGEIKGERPRVMFSQGLQLPRQFYLCWGELP